MRAALATRRMCSAVVPQQPPTSRTPSFISRRAYTPKYSGLAMYRKRPSTRRGTPALGIAARGRPTARIRSTISYMPAGPSPQLTPMTSAPHCASRSAIASGGVPSAMAPKASKLAQATTGRSHTARTASRAMRSSSGWRMVSSTIRSAPARPSACSRKAAPSSARSRAGRPLRLSPEGPIEPPTKAPADAGPAASMASRARVTPASLRARARPSRLKRVRRGRLAPKVLVTRSCAPALRYSR
jgi:hypothetical protein